MAIPVRSIRGSTVSREGVFDRKRMRDNLLLINANLITMNPIYSIHCAANHSIPTERIDVERAIQLYTIDNALLSFEEREKGSIETGKLGDFTIVDNDPTQIPRGDIEDIEVVMTVIHGNVVYAG